MFRIMRLLVMFDLPMKTSANRRRYQRFRKFLIRNGYSMVQYSVYSKIIMNSSVLKYQKKKLYENIPPKGHVLTLVVTEKQFNNIEVLSGEENRSNQEQSTKRMIEL